MEIILIDNKILDIKEKLSENNQFIIFLKNNISDLEFKIINIYEEINNMKKILFTNKLLYINIIKKDLEYSENIKKIIQIKKIIELQKIYIFNKMYKEANNYLIIDN